MCNEDLPAAKDAAHPRDRANWSFTPDDAHELRDVDKDLLFELVLATLASERGGGREGVVAELCWRTPGSSGSDEPTSSLKRTEYDAERLPEQELEVVRLLASGHGLLDDKAIHHLLGEQQCGRGGRNTSPAHRLLTVGKRKGCNARLHGRRFGVGPRSGRRLASVSVQLAVSNIRRQWGQLIHWLKLTTTSPIPASRWEKD